MTILLLPGLYNSTAGHWQTIWENQLPDTRRVQQRDWDRPDRNEWVATLDAAIKGSEGPIVLAAHSLGCALTAWWATMQCSERYGYLATRPVMARPIGSLLSFLLRFFRYFHTAFLVMHRSK